MTIIFVSIIITKNITMSIRILYWYVHHIDTSVMVELDFRIHNLINNESYKLLWHDSDPIHVENFILNLHHISFCKNKVGYINYSSRQHN